MMSIKLIKNGAVVKCDGETEAFIFDDENLRPSLP